MNFYEVLGVNQSSTQDEIKAAFREKAFEYHPDRNQNNAEAEIKFKKLNEAYEVLGDPEKRSKYDSQTRFRHSMSGNFVSPEDMFADLFGGFVTKVKKTVTPRYSTNIKLTLADTLQDQEKNILINVRNKCEKCFGTAVGKSERCRKCNGNGCQNCNNLGIKYPPCEKCNGIGFSETPKEIKITIPKGLFSNTQLQTNTPHGTVLVNITVEHPENIKFGANGRIIMDVSIPYHIAVLGGIHPIQMIDGEKIKVKFPSLKNNQLIKIKGKGLYTGPNTNERGDLFLSPNVQIPENITEEHKTIIEQLANICNREESNNESTI